MSCLRKSLKGFGGLKEGRLTLGCSRQAKLSDATNYTKDVLREYFPEAFLSPRGFQEGEARAIRRENLLLAIADEVARDSILCRRRMFHRQGVQGHGGEARHDGGGGRRPRQRGCTTQTMGSG